MTTNPHDQPEERGILTDVAIVVAPAVPVVTKHLLDKQHKDKKK